MIWKSIALCAIGFATLTGCNKPEQSEFNVNDITTTATIKGLFYYETGDIAAPTANLPAGTKIFVDVPYSNYGNNPDGTPLAGTKTFETTADATGNISIAIPCPIGGLTGVVVRVQDFAGEKIINGVKEKGIFKGGNIFTLPTLIMPSDIYTVGTGSSTAIRNLEFNKLPELVKITVYGYISRPVMTFDNTTSTVDILSRRDSAISDSVLVTVTSFKYGSQSYRVKASNGRFECDVLIGKTGDGGLIVADAIASAPTTFTHRATSSADPYNNKVLEVKGYYSKKTQSSSTISMSYNTTDADATVMDKKIPGVINMQFNAYSEQEFARGLNFGDYRWSSISPYIIN